MLDTLVSIFTNDVVLTAIGLILSAVGVPAYVTKLVVTAAPVAVNLVEQTADAKATGAQKKQAAVAAVRSLLPAVVNLIPGTTARIDKAVEAAVYSETD